MAGLASKSQRRVDANSSLPLLRAVEAWIIGADTRRDRRNVPIGTRCQRERSCENLLPSAGSGEGDREVERVYNRDVSTKSSIRTAVSSLSSSFWLEIFSADVLRRLL